MSVVVVGFGLPGIEEDLPDSVADSGGPVVGLYLPPWEAFVSWRATHPDDSHHDWAVDWVAWHRALVSLYASAPERVHLVNAARLGDPELLVAHLAQSGDAWPADIEWPSLPAGDQGIARLLAAVMAEFGRPLWEEYQALEACAVLLGREPEFLGSAPLPDLADYDEVLATLREVQAVARGSVDAAADKAAEASAEAFARQAQGDAARMRELRQENELLAVQLQQLHEELHFQVESGKQLRQALAEAGAVATEARLALSSLASGDTARV